MEKQIFFIKNLFFLLIIIIQKKRIFFIFFGISILLTRSREREREEEEEKICIERETKKKHTTKFYGKTKKHKKIPPAPLSLSLSNLTVKFTLIEKKKIVLMERV